MTVYMSLALLGTRGRRRGKVYVFNLPFTYFTLDILNLLFPPLRCVPKLHGQVAQQLCLVTVQLLVLCIMLLNIVDDFQLLVIAGGLRVGWGSTTVNGCCLIITEED